MPNLRASTKEQKADRAKGSLQQFASEHDLVISTFFTENESGESTGAYPIRSVCE
jgi:DNA invertase Pin-like site-specific DNA recombinase